MKLIKIQYKKLEELMPIARKPAKISDCTFMCAMLCIVENGCKWKPLLKKYGKWYTIYTKFNRWSQNGTIARILATIKEQKLFNKGHFVLFIDSTSIKVSVQTQTGVEILKSRILDV